MNTKKVGLFFGMSVLSMGLMAQTKAASVTIPGIIKDSGGAFATLIILMLVLSLVWGYVKVNRLFFKEKLDAAKFYLKLKGYVKSEEIDEAVKICESFKNTTLGFIFWSGLSVYKDVRKAGKSGAEMKSSIQNAFDEASMQKMPEIDKGLFWFDLFAQVAMLLGLLGTIWGLIGSFTALATAAPVDQSRLLTMGIKQAMGTTALGLIIAIPIQFLRGWLQTKAEKVINEIDEYSVKMINQLNLTIKD